MSNLVMWNLIVGFLIPHFIAIFQQVHWTKGVRVAVTAVICVFFGLGTAYFNGLFNFHDVIGSILTLGVAAITFYKNFWKQTGVVQKVEAFTSGRKTLRTQRGQMSVIQAVALAVLLLLLVWLVLHLA